MKPPILVSSEGEGVTANFCCEFTDQQVSQSMIEDVLSSSTTPARSRSGSFELYENFEYVEPSFHFSEEKMREIEADLASKLIKLQKKQKHRGKMEEIKSLKAAELDAIEKDRQMEENRKKELDRQASLKRDIEEQERRRIAAEKALYDKEQGVRRLYWENVYAEVEIYTIDLDKIAKKLKNLKKKLREIVELESKYQSGAKLTPEQKEKISKKSEVEAEIECVEKQESDMIAMPPRTDHDVPKPEEVPRYFLSEEGAAGPESATVDSGRSKELSSQKTGSLALPVKKDTLANSWARGVPVVVQHDAMQAEAKGTSAALPTVPVVSTAAATAAGAADAGGMKNAQKKKEEEWEEVAVSSKKNKNKPVH